MSVYVCQREKGPEGDTDLNAKRGSLGASEHGGDFRADPCLVRPEAYTILEPCKLVMKDSICLGTANSISSLNNLSYMISIVFSMLTVAFPQ